jgi:acetyltransferase-like isoleucine patch superfamily enzyme
VREDVAPRTVVGGIPAHFIKSLDPAPEKLLKRRTN